MQSLGIKKFFLDYLIGTALMILLFFLLIGNMTALVSRAKFDLNQACTSSLTTADVLHRLKDDLRTGESCELVLPCEETMVVQCESNLTINALIKQTVFKDSMLRRVNKTLVDTYGVWRFQYPGELKFPLSFIVVLLFYGLILLEAGATFFALWRQDKLKQTLTLPRGSKRDQLFMPIVYAVLWGLFVLWLSFQVFYRYDYPATEHAETLRYLIKSGPGILLVVVLAPLAEELVFRGVLLRFFVERNRLLSGTIFVSLLFSAFHGFVEQSLGWQLYISSIYFFASIILCRIYISQKNVWSPVIFHSAYNSTLLVLYHLYG